MKTKTPKPEEKNKLGNKKEKKRNKGRGGRGKRKGVEMKWQKSPKSGTGNSSSPRNNFTTPIVLSCRCTFRTCCARPNHAPDPPAIVQFIYDLYRHLNSPTPDRSGSSRLIQGAISSGSTPIGATTPRPTGNVSMERLICLKQGPVIRRRSPPLP